MPDGSETGQHHLAIPDIGVIDYDRDDAARSYFAVRECEWFYRCLKQVRQKRDFHTTLRAACAEFLEVTATEKNQRIVEALMAAERSHRARADCQPGKPVLEVARNECPRGCELLALRLPLSFASLNSSYRQAAKRYHPDHGGSHADMVAINEAHGLVHQLLCGDGEPRDISDGELSHDGVPKESCAAYRWDLATVLFRTLVDDWSLAEAIGWLKQVCSPELGWPDARSDRGCWRVLRVADILVARLVVAGLRNEAVSALGLARAVARGNSMATDGPVLAQAEAVVRGARRPGINWAYITHSRQADNLLQLGVIAENRHRTLLRRLAEAEAEPITAHQAYRDTRGFVQNLPVDQIALGKMLRTRLVPEPAYGQTWVTELSDDQQAEYVIAFGAQSSLTLVRKYMYVRFNSLLGSAFEWPEQLDGIVARREAQFLVGLGTGALGWKAPRKLLKALAFLATVPEVEERAHLLRTLRRMSAEREDPWFFREYAYIVRWPLRHLELATRAAEFPKDWPWEVADDPIVEEPDRDNGE